MYAAASMVIYLSNHQHPKVVDYTRWRTARGPSTSAAFAQDDRSAGLASSMTRYDEIERLITPLREKL